MTVPAPVRTAALLLWTLVGLMVVRTLATIVFLDPGPAYIPTGLLVLLILGGLLGLCAVYVQRGAGWARVVATMFTTAAALAGLLVLLQQSTPLFTLLGLLNGGVAVAAIVLLFSKQSNAFFAKKRRQPSL